MSKRVSAGAMRRAAKQIEFEAWKKECGGGTYSQIEPTMKDKIIAAFTLAPPPKPYWVRNPSYKPFVCLLGLGS